MLHACKNVTYQPIDVWCQVRDLSALRGNLERSPYSRGDRRTAGCYGGRAQQTLMAVDIYSIKWLICSQIFCYVNAVSATYQPSLQPNRFFWFGAEFSLIASHKRINFGEAYLLSICLDQSSVTPQS